MQCVGNVANGSNYKEVGWSTNFVEKLKRNGKTATLCGL